MDLQALALLRDGAFIPAMPLVLDSARQLDEAGQRRLIRYYLAAGVDGLAVAVHTTQFEIRDPEIDLFETVLRIAMDEMRRFEAAQGKRLIRVAGVCGQIGQAAAEAKLIQSLGYDAALLSPGGLGAQDEAYLLERTRQVAAVLPVIGFYLQPAVGGRVLSYDYWETLCATEGVVAIKCAAFDRYLTLDVARAVALSDRQVALYTGNDDSIVTDLLTTYSFDVNGCEKRVSVVGGLLGHWAVWTHTAVAMFRQLREASRTGQVTPQLLTLAAQVTDANGAFFDVHNQFHGCIAGIHEVLRRQGLMQGIWCLNPAESLSEGQAEEIDRVYAMYPHLNDDAFVKAFLAQDPA